MPDSVLNKVLDFLGASDTGLCLSVCKYWHSVCSEQGRWLRHVKAYTRLNTDTAVVTAVKAEAAKADSWLQAFRTVPRVLHEGMYVLQEQYYKPACNDLWHQTDQAYLRIIFQRIWWFQPDGSLLYLMVPGTAAAACKALRRNARSALTAAARLKRLSMMRVHEAFWSSRRGPSARSLLWVMAREDGADQATLDLLAATYEGRAVLPQVASGAAAPPHVPPNGGPAPSEAKASDSLGAALPELPSEAGAAAAVPSGPTPGTPPERGQGAPQTDSTPTEAIEPWMIQRTIWLGGDVYATPQELGVTTRAGLRSIMAGAPNRGQGGVKAVDNPTSDNHSSNGPVEEDVPVVASAWQALAVSAQAALTAGSSPDRSGSTAEPRGTDSLFSLGSIGGGAGTVNAAETSVADAATARAAAVRARRRKKATPGTEGLGQGNEHQICYGVWELHGGEVLATIEVPNTGRDGAPPYVCTWRLQLQGRQVLEVQEHNLVPATADRLVALEPTRVMKVPKLEGECADYAPAKSGRRDA